MIECGCETGYYKSRTPEEFICHVNNAKKGDLLTTEMKNGKIISEVVEVIKNGE